MNNLINQIVQMDNFLRGQSGEARRAPDENGCLAFALNVGEDLLVNPLTDSCFTSVRGSVEGPLDVMRANYYLAEVHAELLERAKVESDRLTKASLEAMHRRALAAVEAAGS